LFDRIEVGRVFGKEQKARSSRFDGGATRLSFVRSEIVEDDNVVAFERGNQELLDIREKQFAIDGAVEQTRRFDPIAAQRRQECRGLVTVGDFVDQASAAERPAVEPSHVCFGPRLVDEDQARSVDLLLPLLPAPAVAADVRPVLLAATSVFF
jgi:hypothetical protein